jgi:hypothetical protein
MVFSLGKKKNCRVTFELEPGAVGNTTDFKEANKRLEWGLKKARMLLSLSLSLAHTHIPNIDLSNFLQSFFPLLHSHIYYEFSL